MNFTRPFVGGSFAILLASAPFLAHAGSAPAAALAALLPSQTPTRWSDPATWGGSLPKAGDRVEIPAGKTVILDTATPALRGLVIKGALQAHEGPVAITSGWVVVKGGTLSIGSAARPYRHTATITLTGSSTADTPDTPGMGSKVLGVMGGRLELHGDPSRRSWTKLAANAARGATSLVLADPPGWKAGDRIVIATSTRHQAHHDVAEVASVSGRTVTLRQPLKFSHIGTTRRLGTFTLDVRAEVGLLTRNITVTGDPSSDASRIGGHAIFMNGMCPSGSANCQCGVDARQAKVQISQVRFARMGQFNRTGRYPVHFHMAGAMPDAYIRDSSVDGSIQRGIVLHDVSGVVVSQNVVFNTVGHNFVVETAQTTGNLLERNLAVVNQQARPLQTADTFVDQNDRLPASYWMRSGRNSLVGNHSAGSTASGFIFDGILGDGPVDFRSNTVHAAMGQAGVGEGDFDIMAGVLFATLDNRPPQDVIADTLSYHNAVGFWPEESDGFVIHGLKAVDNDLAIEPRTGRATFVGGLLSGRLTEPRDEPGALVHFQYGGRVTLDGVTFGPGEGGVGGATDIASAPQADLVIRNPKFLGSKPFFNLGWSIISTLEDSLIAPKGSYSESAVFALPGAARVVFTDGDDEVVTYRSPVRPSYSELDLRRRSAPGYRIHTSQLLRRQDGLRFAEGLFGYSVITEPTLAYEVEAPSPSGYALRLHEGVTADPRVIRESLTVPVWIKVAAPPSTVRRGGSGEGRPGSHAAASPLRLASSLADHQANPLTTYWQDLATSRILVRASHRWVHIVP